ncbi:mediator complex, subunit Med10 [Xylariaceae sp. FL0016]|nr:mediator complex, subunit Med10 [Xylariaceae sp. FL0016]
MAPMAPADHNTIEQQLKDTIQSLHNIMVQVSSYDNNATIAANTNSSNATTNTPGTIPTPNPNAISSPNPNVTGTGRTSRDALTHELSHLSRTLRDVHRTASTPDADASLPHIPPELVTYVDNGRNPDIYTREFVELVRRGNQVLAGKQRAFASFRDVLAREVEAAMPELREDVALVVRSTSAGDGAAGAQGS